MTAACSNVTTPVEPLPPGGQFGRWWPASVVLVAIVLVTEVVIRGLHVASYLVPAPSQVLAQLWAERSSIATNLGFTSLEAIGGFVIGTVLAVVTSVVFAHSRLAERSLFPLAVVLQTVPIVVIAPLLIIAFGNGLVPKAVAAGLITFFPVLVNMTKGLSEVDPDLLDLFALLNANRWQVLWRLRLPSSLPFLFASLRISAANCFIGAIVAEWIGADRGIGYLIQLRMYQLRIDGLYAAMLASSAAAVAFFGVVVAAEYVLAPWRRNSAAEKH